MASAASTVIPSPLARLQSPSSFSFRELTKNDPLPQIMKEFQQIFSLFYGSTDRALQKLIDEKDKCLFVYDQRRQLQALLIYKTSLSNLSIKDPSVQLTKNVKIKLWLIKPTELEEGLKTTLAAEIVSLAQRLQATAIYTSYKSQNCLDFFQKTGFTSGTYKSQKTNLIKPFLYRELSTFSICRLINAPVETLLRDLPPDCCSQEELLQKAQKDQFNLYLAFDDRKRKIAAVIICAKALDANNRLNIESFYVSSRVSGQGLRTALILEFSKIAKTFKATSIGIVTGEANREFLQQQGFTFEATLSDPYRPGTVKYLFSKKVS